LKRCARPGARKTQRFIRKWPMLDGKGKQVRRTAMTIAEILQQAKTLSGQERKELVKLLVDSLDVSEVAPVSSGVYLNYAD
jgi:hypothetical protein